MLRMTLPELGALLALLLSLGPTDEELRRRRRSRRRVMFGIFLGVVGALTGYFIWGAT